MSAFRHFRTVVRHRHAVIRHCAKAGIWWQGLFHDLSKFSPTEFLAGARFYQGTRSPNECEREQNGYSAAWMHHKGRNKHHFEYWTDYHPVTRKMTPVKMPFRYVVEMVCDRVAAGKIYRGKDFAPDNPLNYFLRGKPTRNIHPETSELLEKLLRMYAEEGEERTFAYMREQLRRGGEY